jgi:hypothetical protein
MMRVQELVYVRSEEALELSAAKRVRVASTKEEHDG